ncbi:MAG TPA: hypothetical protein VKT51_11940 [Candidatus Eremiobacteraceae bacterium]|nr:hypothetical protein [Candidatus Eremiobacteraceae bacterium]
MSRAEDITPAMIFVKHATAVGYSLSDGRAKAFVMKSSDSWVDFNGGRHAALVTLRRAGALYREDRTYAGGVTTNGFDGSDFWRGSANDTVTADGGYSRPFDVSWAVVDSEGYDASLSAELHDTTRSAYVVRIHPAGGMPADVYFDRMTWLVDQVIVDPDGDAIREEYADYKTFGAVQVATTRRINGDTISVTKFDWDVPVAADELSAPPPQNYISFPTGGSVTVPFDPHGGIIVNASINGYSGHFAIDTMISGISVDPLMAERARLVDSTDARFDFFNPDDLVSTKKAAIQIGGLALNNVQVEVFSNNLADGFTPFDGYIGLDLFAKAITSVNFDWKTITFSDPAKFHAPPNAYPLPIALDQGIAQTIVTFNDKQRAYMLLSPSFQSSVALWQIYMKRHPEVADSDGTIISFNTPSFAEAGRLHSLKVGPFEQDLVPVMPLGFPQGESFNTGAEGILGEGVLSPFNIVIDYPDLKLFLTPAGSAR